MAQQCVSASNQYFSFPALGVSIPPVTLSLWFNVSAVVSGKHSTLFCWRGTINTELFLHSLGSDWQLRYSIAGGSQWNLSTGLNVGSGTWQHACVAITSSQARLYLNGTSFTANVSHGTTNVNGTGYLAKDTLNDGLHVAFNGAIAEAAIWNAALTADECQALAKRLSPLALTQRLPNLLMYRDLVREISRGIGPTLTAVNTPTVAPHPPLVHCAGRMRPGVFPAHFVSPYRPSAATAHANRALRGVAELAGAAAGTTAPIAEVSS
jgi:hypothetical protein